MKKFVQCLFLACFFWGVPAVLVAAEPSAAEESAGKKFPLLEQLLYLADYYAEIDKKYPGDELFEADLADTVRKMYPLASPQEVYDKADSIKNRLRIYRYFKGLYNKITSEMLAPPPPPLIVDDDDFEMPDTGEYIESEDLVVINDFKKVLSYSYDKRDIEAIEAKIERDRAAEASGSFTELKSHVKKLEWRKLPFYGLVYDDPFTGRAGIGDWQEKQGIKGRLLSAVSAVGNGQALLGAIQLEIPDGAFIWASDGKNHYKPRLDMSLSNNLASYRLYQPLPQRLYAGETDYTVYTHELVMPVELWVVDKEQPLELNGRLQIQLCNMSGCRPETLNIKLTLAAGDSEASAVNNFIVTRFNLLPPAADDDLKIRSVVVDKPLNRKEPQVLRITADIDASLSDFEIFAENKAQIELSAPRITIDGKRITARFTAADSKDDLIGKEFMITAKLGKFISLRRIFTAKEASAFDIQKPGLSLGLFFLAILGGFILNFMPCVFPALSLKLMGLSAFGGSNEKTVRRTFSLTAAGIFIGFALITLLLCLFKLAGKSLGWGMQFQNPLFLVCMMTVIVLFIAQIEGIIRVSPPVLLQKAAYKKTRGFLHLLSGVFVVLLATPCTAPYLGTAVGFALAGTYGDIVVIMTAIALGLSLPYLLIWLWPDIVLAVPKPGMWQRKLERFMILMLFLTLLWLMSVFASQSGWGAAGRQILYLFLVWFILWFRSLIFQQLDDMAEPEDAKNRSRRLFLLVSRLLLAGLLLSALWDSHASFRNYRRDVERTTVEELNYAYIRKQVAEGRTVFVSIGADWCLTCRYNEITVLNNDAIKGYLRRHGIDSIEIDWTGYNPQVLEFMEKFGRKGLPFYVIFSPKIPDGLVLPEILTEKDLGDILREAV